MIGIYEIDFRTMRLLHVNQTLCDVMGYTEDEMREGPIAKFITPESLGLLMQRMAKMHDNIGLVDGKAEFVAVTKDEKHIRFAIEAFYKIENGLIIGALVAVREIK